MPKLLIYHNDVLDSEIELGAENLRLGRGADNDVVLADPTKTLSRRHAQLVVERGTYTLVDQNSQNGIWAAGVRVPSAPLKSGAPIVMGAYKLLLKPDLVVSTGEETMLIPRGGLDLKAADPFATVFIGKESVPAAEPTMVAGAGVKADGVTELRPVVVPPKPEVKAAPDANPAAAAAKPAADAAKPPAPPEQTAKPAAAATAPPAAPTAKSEPTPAAAPAAKADPPKADAPKVEAKPAAAAPPAPPAPPKPAAPPPAPAPAPAAAKAPEPAKPAAKAPEPAKPAVKKPAADGSRTKYVAAAAVLLLALGGGGYYMFGRPSAPATQTASTTTDTAKPAPPAAEPPAAAKPEPEPAPAVPTPVAKGAARPAKVAGTVKEPPVKPVTKVETPVKPLPEPPPPPPPPPPVVDPQTLFEKARSAMIAGDYLGAVSGFEQVLKLDANYPNAANLLGVARGGAKNAAQLAIDAGNKAEMNGDYLGARKQYDRAEQLDPGAPAVASAIRRLIARMQGAGEAAFKAARQYDASNKTKEAIASYESALQLLPANHESVPVARERLAALKGGA